MASPRFYNKNGTLTAYSFACGYLEQYGDCRNPNKDGVFIERDGAVWAVKGARFDSDGKWERIWECFDTVTEARRFARTIGKFRPASDAFSGI